MPMQLYLPLHLYSPVKVHPVSYAQETDGRVQGVQGVQEVKEVQEVQQVIGDHEVIHIQPAKEDVIHIQPAKEDNVVIGAFQEVQREVQGEGVARANRKKREKRERIKNNEVYHTSCHLIPRLYTTNSMEWLHETVMDNVKYWIYGLEYWPTFFIKYRPMIG